MEMAVTAAMAWAVDIHRGECPSIIMMAIAIVVAEVVIVETVDILAEVDIVTMIANSIWLRS